MPLITNIRFIEQNLRSLDFRLEILIINAGYNEPRYNEQSAISNVFSSPLP